MNTMQHQIKAGDLPEVRTGWGDALQDCDGGPYWEVHVVGCDIWAEERKVLADWLRAAADAVEALNVDVTPTTNGS